MTVEKITLASLRRAKNSVIGNPSAKLKMAHDEPFITELVKCLNHPPLPEAGSPGTQTDIRIEAAQVIASLSYGSQQALRSLLRAEALQSILTAIAEFRPSDPFALKTTFARGLRAIATAIAETVGPSHWGLKSFILDVKDTARTALDTLFQAEFLDIYLPLLVGTSTQMSTTIAQMLGSCVRSQPHRTAVAEWLPPADRAKESKGKRGWERRTILSDSRNRQGGWVVRNAVILLQSQDNKLQEASLSALAALADSNASLANILSRPNNGETSPLVTVLSMSKSRSPDVQLAACLCATHIIRSLTSNHSGEPSSALTVIHVINRMIASSTDSHSNRAKACFILYCLIKDDQSLCHDAAERGSLDKLSVVLKAITPQEATPEWDEDEPESLSSLREAAFTAVAALALFDNDIRRDVTDTYQLIPTIHVSLSHRRVGVRYAACQCARALSRAVAVIRTNILDSGLGETVFQIFRKEDEDRRVTSAALATVCNLVNDFSPLRKTFLESGLLPRLVQILDSGDSDLKLSALWAVKNLLRKSTTDLKQNVMSQIGWDTLTLYLQDVDGGIQEQAWNVVRNIAESGAGIDLVFRKSKLENVLDMLSVALKSPDDRVQIQAAYVIGNLANGSVAYQEDMLKHPALLASLRTCLAEGKSETRKPAIRCVLELARLNPEHRPMLVEAGMVPTLRRISEWAGGVSISPGGGLSGVVEMDRDVMDQAKDALEWILRSEALYLDGEL